MSNLNTILNKLGKIEEIHETNLAKHEVELSIKDDAKQLVTKYYGLTDAINSKYSAIQKEIRFLTEKIDEANKLTNEMPKVISKYENLAKEIGIDVNNIQELKDMNLAVKDIAQYKTLASKLKSL